MIHLYERLKTIGFKVGEDCLYFEGKTKVSDFIIKVKILHPEVLVYFDCTFDDGDWLSQNGRDVQEILTGTENEIFNEIKYYLDYCRDGYFSCFGLWDEE